MGDSGRRRSAQVGRVCAGQLGSAQAGAVRLGLASLAQVGADRVGSDRLTRFRSVEVNPGRVDYWWVRFSVNPNQLITRWLLQ